MEVPRRSVALIGAAGCTIAAALLLHQLHTPKRANGDEVSPAAKTPSKPEPQQSPTVESPADIAALPLNTGVPVGFKELPPSPMNLGDHAHSVEADSTQSPTTEQLLGEHPPRAVTPAYVDALPPSTKPPSGFEELLPPTTEPPTGIEELLLPAESVRIHEYSPDAVPTAKLTAASSESGTSPLAPPSTALEEVPLVGLLKRADLNGHAAAGLGPPRFTDGLIPVRVCGSVLLVKPKHCSFGTSANVAGGTEAVDGNEEVVTTTPPRESPSLTAAVTWLEYKLNQSNSSKSIAIGERAGRGRCIIAEAPLPAGLTIPALSETAPFALSVLPWMRTTRCTCCLKHGQARPSIYFELSAFLSRVPTQSMSDATHHP